MSTEKKNETSKAKKGKGVILPSENNLKELSNNDLLESIPDDSDEIIEMKDRFNGLIHMVSKPQLYYKREFENAVEKAQYQKAHGE